MTEPTITDEGVERLRTRVGVPEPWTRRPHYLRPNTDAFRIVAEAYGDDNPLWADPEYATASVWGSERWSAAALQSSWNLTDTLVLARSTVPVVILARVPCPG